jgi:tetratricopeptide (TPR) repeat protein
LRDRPGAGAPDEPETALSRKTPPVRQEKPDIRTIAETPGALGVAANADEKADDWPPGTRAGRYMLLHRLGAGGAGTVYAAYDPELDRKVAIKLLSAVASGSLSASQGHVRLLREAQAMARLKHPNVMPVYDVGTIHQNDESSVFLAMELVEGGTLREWLKGTRSRAQILEVMAAAGRGLAAAHAAGLVHRDFKPDNVLVGSDGRVLVTDFGIVRASGTADSPAAVSLAPRDILATPLTQADAVVGTPGYMAPEQYRGLPVDARTDQFSFCVTLHEALTGKRPFAGKKFEDLMDATLSGRIVATPEQTEMPAWLRRIVLRGLETESGKRHESMDALLRALADDPAIRRRRVWAIAGGVALLTLTGAGVARLSTRNHDLCRGAERKLAGVWDDAMRGRVQDRFHQLGVSAAITSSVTTVLDRYAHAFVEQHTEACESTQLRGEQPEPVMALRMTCLDGRLKEMGALTTLLAGADRETAQTSVEATSSLSTLAACTDVAALMARVPAPSDPKVRKEIDRLHGRIAEARARLDLARNVEALAITDEVLTAAAPLNYSPLRAEALELKGYLLDEVGKPHESEATLAEAIDTGYEGHDDALVARAAISLAEVYAVSLARRTDGFRWNRLARAAVARMGGSDELEATRIRVEATLYLFEGKGKEAVGAAERALKLAEKVHGPDSLKVAVAHGVLGSANRVAGDYARARIEHQANYDGFLKLLGPDHPKLIVPLNNLGIVADSEEKEEEAAKYYHAAVELAERALGPNHPRLAVALANYSSALRGLHRYDEALAASRRALAIYDAKFGREYPDSHEPLLSIGLSLMALHQAGDAVAPLERGLSLVSKGESPQADIAEIQDALADALWISGRDRARARHLEEEALKIYRSLGDIGAENVKKTEAWLKNH